MCTFHCLLGMQTSLRTAHERNALTLQSSSLQCIKHHMWFNHASRGSKPCGKVCGKLGETKLLRHKAAHTRTRPLMRWAKGSQLNTSVNSSAMLGVYLRGKAKDHKAILLWSFYGQLPKVLKRIVHKGYEENAEKCTYIASWCSIDLHSTDITDGSEFC